MDALSILISLNKEILHLFCLQLCTHFNQSGQLGQSEQSRINEVLTFQTVCNVFPVNFFYQSEQQCGQSCHLGQSVLKQILP